MADIVLGITLKADGRGLVGELRTSREALDRLGQAGGRTRGEARRLQRSTANLSRGMEDARRRANLLRLALLALATGGALRLAKSFIDAASETENLAVSLRFLTDDAERAVDIAREFASGVAFSFQEIQQAAPVLLTVARDLEEFNRLLEITGDIAAVTGIPFVETAAQIQRAFSAGIASADRFRERGVGVMLGFQQGVQVSAEETRERILGLWEDSTFALRGAARSMETTWTGITSFLQDKWFQVRVALLDAGPFDFLKASFAELDDALGAVLEDSPEDIEAFGQAIVETVEEIVLGTADVVDTLLPLVAGLADLVGSMIDQFNRLPPFAQEFGIIGAIFGGRRLRILLGGILLSERFQKFMEDRTGIAGRIDIPLPGPGQEPLPNLLSGAVFGAGFDPIASDFGEEPPTLRSRAEDVIARIERRAAELRQARRAGGGRGSPAAAGGGDAVAKETAKILEALRDEAAALGRTAIQQEVLNNLKDAGIDTSRAVVTAEGEVLGVLSAEGEEVAELTAKLFRNEEAQKRQAEIQKEAARVFEATRTEAERYAAEVDNLSMLFNAGAIDGETFARALARAREQLERAEGPARDLEDAFGDLTDTISTELEDAFVRMRKEGFSAIDVLEALGDTAIRVATRIAITKPLERGLGALFESVLSGSLFGGGRTLANVEDAPIAAAVAHGGGVVGSGDLAGRAVPAAAFAGAPRFRGGGVAGGEVPAILHRGEGVFTPAQMRALGPGVTVQVIDQRGGGERPEVRQTVGADGRQRLEIFIRDRVDDGLRGGDFDGAMRDAFGLRRAGVL